MDTDETSVDVRAERRSKEDEDKPGVIKATLFFLQGMEQLETMSDEDRKLSQDLCLNLVSNMRQKLEEFEWRYLRG